MAGLYTGGTTPILTKRTMGTIANDIVQWDLRTIVNWEQWELYNKLLGLSQRQVSLEQTRLRWNVSQK